MIGLRTVVMPLLGLSWLATGHAMTWKDWWKTPDHQAHGLWQAGRFAEAEKLFQRSDWRAAAAYRAGNYQQAVDNYRRLQTTEGDYNAGNALAKLGQYAAAIAAYNQALARDPQHQDALFNRDLVKKLLAQSQQSKPQPSSQPKQSSQSPQSNPPSQAAASAGSQPQPSKSDPTKPESESNPNPNPTRPQSAKPPPAQAPSAGSESATQAKAKASQRPASQSEREAQQAKTQWLRLIPDDPAYLLREKFLRDHLRRQSGQGGE